MRRKLCAQLRHQIQIVYEPKGSHLLSADNHLTIWRMHHLWHAQDVNDPAVVVTFPLVDDPETSFVAWTTTPW